jgi:chromosome segregation ATPase
MFFSGGFKSFYEQTVEAVRSGIFEFYAGSGGCSGDDAVDSPHKQVIEMQKEKISELEARIKALESGGAVVSSSAAPGTSSVGTSAGGAVAMNGGGGSEGGVECAAELREAQEKIAALEAALADRERSLDGMAASETAISTEADTQRHRAELAERQLKDLQVAQRDRQNSLYLSGDAEDSAIPPPPELLKRYREEIFGLKQSVVELSDERQRLKEALEQRERKIELLEEDLRGPVPYEMTRERKITELEVRDNYCGLELSNMTVINRSTY